MTSPQHIEKIEQDIAALEALRGTPDQPVALDAQLGQLRRTLAWHQRRLDPIHPNTGRVSLFERTGRSKRVQRRFNTRRDYPAVSLQPIGA